MKYRQALPHDKDFISGLLSISCEKPEMGIGYPGGTIDEVEQELNAIGKIIEESFIIAEDSGISIGCAGIFDASWGLYIIGPLFNAVYYNHQNIADLFADMLKMKKLAGKTIRVDAKESNITLITALESMDFRHDYSGISMSYNLNKSAPEAISAEIIEITSGDNEHLSRINEIFTAYLEPWEDHDISDLEECLEEGNVIAAAFDNGVIAGAIVWEWGGDYGEIEYICIDKMYQRKGYARQLMDYAVNKIHATADNSNENMLYLDVAQNNKPALDFYINYGFTIEFLRKVYEKKTKSE